MTESGIFARVSDVLLAAYTKADMRGTDEVDAIELLGQVEQYFDLKVAVGGSDEYTAALNGLLPTLAAVGDKQITDGILESVLDVTTVVAQEAGSQLGREIVALFLVIDFLIGRLGSLTGQSKDEIARMLAR